MVHFFLVEVAFCLEFADLFDALLLVGGKFQVFFVAPEHRGLCFDAGLGQDLVEVHNLPYDERRKILTWYRPLSPIIKKRER